MTHLSRAGSRHQPSGLLRTLVYGSLIAFALIAPGMIWQLGCLEREATTLMRQYAADRPVLQKTFDPHANDLGTYQARELSYFIDFVDTQVYEVIAARSERAFFIPFSALVVSVLLVMIFLIGCRSTTQHVDLITSALLLSCFLASFGFISTMGVFYRSGKPVLTVVVLAALFHLRAVHRRRAEFDARQGPAQAGHYVKPPGRTWVDAAIMFVLALVAGLLDRQGFFYVLTACVVLFVHVRLTGELRDVLLATCAAAIALTFYNFAIAPMIVHWLNGYWPDFSYQTLPAPELLRPQIHVSRAARLLAMNVAMMGGGFPAVFLTVAALALLLARHRFGTPDVFRSRAAMAAFLLRDRSGRVVLYGLVGLAFQIVMFAVMVARHGDVFRSIDHRYWYYPAPFLATVVFAALLMVDAALGRLRDHERKVVRLILAVVAVSNALSLPAYREAMTDGPYFGPVYRQSERLKASIASGVADPKLEPEYRVFFEYDQRLRVRPPETANARPGALLR